MEPDNRLLWRCRRGLLELDILLKRFLDRHYADLTLAETTAFAALVELQDHDLWALVSHGELQPDYEQSRLLALLRQTMQGGNKMNEARSGNSSADEKRSCLIS